MKPDLLDLKLTRYLCPHCGAWHDLPCHTTLKQGIFLECDFFSANDDIPNHYSIRIQQNYLQYDIISYCGVAPIKGKVKISSIVEDEEHSRVIFSVPFTLNTYKCFVIYNSTGCKRITCNFYTLAVDDSQKLKLGFEFKNSEYKQVLSGQKPNNLNSQEPATENKEDATMSKEKKTTI